MTHLNASKPSIVDYTIDVDKNQDPPWKKSDGGNGTHMFHTVTPLG